MKDQDTYSLGNNLCNYLLMQTSAVRLLGSIPESISFTSNGKTRFEGRVWSATRGQDSKLKKCIPNRYAENCSRDSRLVNDIDAVVLSIN